MARTRRTEGRNSSSARIEERLVEGARAFVTIGPEHPTWGGPRADEEGEIVDQDVHVASGSFVRVEPPPEATDEDVDAVKRAAVKSGAVRVMVLPRRRAAEVLAPREKRPHRRARDVVVELVAESPCDDKAALGAFVEAVMSARGI